MFEYPAKSAHPGVCPPLVRRTAYFQVEFGHPMVGNAIVSQLHGQWRFFDRAGRQGLPENNVAHHFDASDGLLREELFHDQPSSREANHDIRREACRIFSGIGCRGNAQINQEQQGQQKGKAMI